MDYLTYPENYLQEKGAILTAGEIAGQPALWKRTAECFFGRWPEIAGFLETAIRGADHIMLTGAGTSSFMGLSLEGVFFRRTGILCRAVATTNIVSHPQDYFDKDRVPFILSFARSGNSPESCAALELADRFSKACFHLIITCDEKGSLASYHSDNPVFTLVLPPQANDMGLAMTGSYSSMLLAALLMVYGKERSFCEDQLAIQLEATGAVLQGEIDKLRDIASRDFKRAVFLGSGELYGTAEEAALKLQELTDGRVICKADTYLGFRHGPRAVIDSGTLVTYFFSRNDYARRYEMDLLRAMTQGNRALFQLGIGEKFADGDWLNEKITLSDKNDRMHEDFLPLSAIVPAQLLAFFKSLQLGLRPDAPSASGTISRVVEGVTIYPV